MFGPRRGSSVIGLVGFIVVWLAALTLVILGHNRLTGLTEDAKKNSLEAEMKRKEFDPEKETANADELFHRRDTLRKEVDLLGRELGFGLDKPLEMDDTAFENALKKAVDKIKNEFMAASPKDGLPSFERQKPEAEISAERLYSQDMRTGPDFSTKFDVLLVMLVGRVIRYQDMLAYYADLKGMAQGVTEQRARAAGYARDGISASDPVWASDPKATAFDIPGKNPFVLKVDQLRAVMERDFLSSGGGQATSIEDAETRAVAQMTDYVTSTVDGKIKEYDQLIDAEEKKLDSAVQAFKTERNALGSAIKNVVKERHRGRETDGTIRVLPPIPVSTRDQTTHAPAMEDQASDGQIVVVNPGTREAYVQLGRKSGVVEGMSFLVYRQGPQRQWHYKGKVQVKTVLADMSVLSIVDEVSRFDPISAGDEVFNKIYDAEDPVRLVFLGEMSPQDTTRFRHLIERIGGVVEAQVTVLTDFVILLPDHEKHSGSKDNIDRAKEIGVRGMTVDELRIYVEY